MLLDWLTLKLRVEDIGEREALREHMLNQPHHMKYTPATGEIEYNTPGRQCIRSDSHRVVVAVGSQVSIEGSPARSSGQPNNVFGTLDIVAAAREHIAAAEACLGFDLPHDLSLYWVTRVDVTCNYDMGGLNEVRQALGYLRQTDAGRYKLRAKHSTVYWSPSSAMRSGKAYAKGPHAERQHKRGEASYTPEQRELVEGVLRLELKLGNEYWRRHRAAGGQWWNVSADELLDEHDRYFSKLIGTTEVSNMDDVRLAIYRAAPTEKQGDKVYATWALIQVMGHEHVREMMKGNRTWYRHLKILQEAGLGWGDICAGKVVQLRKTPLVIGQPLRGWQDLKAA